MSAEANIRERLFDLCIGHSEWHIRKDDGICMTFSHSDSLDPEREAIAWLAEHRERYPERFAGYEVHRVTVQSELQLAALALLDELDRLRAPPAPGAPAGFKLVPIEATRAMLEEVIGSSSSTYEMARVRYAAMLDAAPGAPGQEAAAVQAVGAWQDIATAPEDVLVIVGWRDEEDTENPDRHMFDYLEDGVWANYFSEHEHYAIAGVAHGRSEDAPYTHWMPMGPVPAALPGEKTS